MPDRSGSGASPAQDESETNTTRPSQSPGIAPSLASLSGVPAAPAELIVSEPLPEMLGEYRLLRRLGKGGMAEVYLAEQTSLRRNVALKVLRRHLLGDPTYVQRFKAEALAAASLCHPNIVQVYSIGESEGIEYIAQEYVQGGNLRELLTRKGPPDAPLAMHIMKQVASALHAASQAGIVHRDIKPENIMITRRGEVKVADFGLAQLTQGGERLSLTQSGMTMGTPLYMSPEQVHGSRLDPRSDIYSFGVTCYHMLAGTPPFRGESAVAVAVKHLNEKPIPLEKLRPDLPLALCAVINKMMAKLPADRFPNGQAVLKELKSIASPPPRGTETGAVELPVRVGAVASLRAMPKLRFLSARSLGPYLLAWLDLDWRQQWKPWCAALLATALAGAALGWALRPSSPLAAPLPPRENAASFATPAEQMYFALTHPDDEQAWQAVLQRFPKETEAVRAEEKLALFYVRQDRLDEALTIFDRLAGLGADEPARRAFGLAGQALVHARRGEHRDMELAREALGPLESHLSAEMRLRLEDARRSSEPTP